MASADSQLPQSSYVSPLCSRTFMAPHGQESQPQIASCGNPAPASLFQTPFVHSPKYSFNKRSGDSGEGRYNSPGRGNSMCEGVSSTEKGTGVQQEWFHVSTPEHTVW